MSANEGFISAGQCRAARALTDISRAMLAEMSGLPEAAIRDFEKKLAESDGAFRLRLRQALEAHGAVFIAEDVAGGQGVRLKFTSAEAARIERLENEGGPVGEDDVAD
jgi:hypothetical protein